MIWIGNEVNASRYSGVLGEDRNQWLIRKVN